MKNYFIFLTIFIAIISAISAETVTEELLRAQDELNHSNLFVEHYLFRHRDAVTTLLAQLQLFSKDIFMDTYTEIKHLARDTEHIIRENEPSACRDRIERRFDLQVMRFGQRLSGCLAVATQIIKSEYSDLNFYHTDGQRLTVHTPNQSLNIISQTDIFEGKFHFLINQRLRQLLSRAARKFICRFAI